MGTLLGVHPIIPWLQFRKIYFIDIAATLLQVSWWMMSYFTNLNKFWLATGCEDSASLFKPPRNKIWLRSRKKISTWFAIRVSNTTYIYIYIYLVSYLFIPGPSSLGAKWLRYRVSIQHLLGFNWHPDWKVLVCIYIYIFTWMVWSWFLTLPITTNPTFGSQEYTPGTQMGPLVLIGPIGFSALGRPSKP